MVGVVYLGHFLPLFIHSPVVDSATCSSLEITSASLRTAGHMHQKLNWNVLTQEVVSWGWLLRLGAHCFLQASRQFWGDPLLLHAWGGCGWRFWLDPTLYLVVPPRSPTRFCTFSVPSFSCWDPSLYLCLGLSFQVLSKPATISSYSWLLCLGLSGARWYQLSNTIMLSKTKPTSISKWLICLEISNVCFRKSKISGNRISFSFDKLCITRSIVFHISCIIKIYAWVLW